MMSQRKTSERQKDKLGDKLRIGAKTERLLENVSPLEQKKRAGSNVNVL